MKRKSQQTKTTQSKNRPAYISSESEGDDAAAAKKLRNEASAGADSNTEPNTSSPSEIYLMKRVSCNLHIVNNFRKVAGKFSFTILASTKLYQKRSLLSVIFLKNMY